MVNDDFSALDFLSADGFRLSSGPQEIQRPAKKKRFAKRHKASAPAKRRLTELLPLLGRKLAKPGKAGSVMSGWPMALSWPGQDLKTMPNWDEAVDGLHSGSPMN